MTAGRDPAPVELLHKATLGFRQHGVGVELEVLEGVFASAGVDAGTRHLLRWLADERYASARTVLDVGCGYGPLALWLAAAAPGRRALAVDRDARAVAATAAGAAANAADVEAVGALGYDGVADERFDLVVCNVPAKVGGAALGHLVLDAHHHLTEGGRVAIVVVDRLAADVAALLEDDAIELHAARPNRAYTAFEYSFRGPPGPVPMPGFERGVYRRGRSAFGAGVLSWTADVSHSIDEFDQLGHGTRAALELIGRPPGGTVVLDGVGQGHLALALRAAGHGGTLRLVDRDLLALRTTDANLGDGGTELEHVPCLGAAHLAGAALAVVALPEREPVAITAAVLGSALAAGDPPPVVLHGRSADVSRVLDLLRRHGARLTVDREAKVGSHRAVATHRAHAHRR